jgi:ribosomal protein L11 methyltransferase
MFAATERTGIHTPTEPDASEIVVRLLPVGARARGWGWEPETRAAIAWLEERVQPGMQVADIGTGTGILAIVAKRLGAVVTAYESVDSVREIAQENFALNLIDAEVLGEYDGAQGFDLAVANLGDVDYGPILTCAQEVWTSA